MLSKDKLNSLNKYLQEMASKLSSPLPEKHKGHPDTYQRFLKNEIESTKAKIDAAKLEGTK